MISLIVTANDELYSRLSNKTHAEGNTHRRATNVLDAYRQARTLGREAEMIIDLSLPTADTLIEALHSRKMTAGIPLLAVKCGSRPVPLALRRLCADVWDAGTLCPEVGTDSR